MQHLPAVNGAAMRAEWEQRRNPATSIFTHVEEQARRYGVREADVLTQLVKLFPKFEFAVNDKRSRK